MEPKYGTNSIAAFMFCIESSEVRLPKKLAGIGISGQVILEIKSRVPTMCWKGGWEHRWKRGDGSFCGWR